MAPCPGVPAQSDSRCGGETAYSEGAPPAHEARPDENNDQQDEGDAENDQPRLVGLETTRYGVVDDPVRIHRCGGR